MVGNNFFKSPSISSLVAVSLFFAIVTGIHGLISFIFIAILILAVGIVVLIEEGVEQ